MRKKSLVATLFILVILFTVASSLYAGDVSRSFRINVFIPVIPGLNAPEDGTLLVNENASSDEMITTTEEYYFNEQKIILQTIAPK